MLFSEALEIRPGLTAVMGSGGKTSLVCRLADELFRRARHHRDLDAYAAGPCPAGARRHRCARHARHRGNTVRRRQIRSAEQSWAELCALADYVLVEADGSRGLPLKAHLSHEPVLPQEAGQVIAVLGLTGLGRPIAEAAHRAGALCRLAGCTPEDIATPERAARVLEAEALHTRVLLNQADAADGTALLARLHCPAVLASLRKGEIVSCSF